MVELTISSRGVELSPGGEVVLRHQTWDDYESILHSRHGKAAVRVKYNAHTREIRLMAPLPKHANLSQSLSAIAQALLRHFGMDWQGFDPVTLKRFGEVGLEPDACFYIANRHAILGKERIDLAEDPPPDLAIEVDETSATRPEDYAPTRIGELWIYGDGQLFIYVFDGHRYVERSESPIFPNLPLVEWIPKYLRRSWTSGSSVALREFELELSQRK